MKWRWAMAGIHPYETGKKRREMTRKMSNMQFHRLIMKVRRAFFLFEKLGILWFMLWREIIEVREFQSQRNQGWVWNFTTEDRGKLGIHVAFTLWTGCFSFRLKGFQIFAMLFTVRWRGLFKLNLPQRNLSSKCTQWRWPSFFKFLVVVLEGVGE